MQTETATLRVTEAKLTQAGEDARSASTIEVQGSLDVRAGQQVFLHLPADEVQQLERQGDDLVLIMLDGTVVRLIGYFDGEIPRQLFLEDEDKTLVGLEFGSEVSEGSITYTATPQTEVTPFHSLTEGVAGSGVSGGALLGGLAGVGVLAALAGGGGGGGGSGSVDPAPQPPAPNPDRTAPSAPTGLKFGEAGATLEGLGEAGAQVTVRNAKGAVVGTGVVEADGRFKIALAPPLTNGEAVTVELADAAGNVSATSPATAPDSTAPQGPQEVEFNATGDGVSGTGEPGSLVTLRNADGQEVASGKVDAEGHFEIKISPALVGGEILEVQLQDAAGNRSPKASVAAPDLTYPGGPDQDDAPVVTIAEAADGVSAAEIADGLQVDIILTPGTQAGDRVTLTVSGAQDEVILHTVTAADITAGKLTLVGSAALTDGSYRAVVVIDDTKGKASRPSDPVDFVVDSQTPQPIVTMANGWGLSGTGEVGATVALLDAAGEPVLDAGGQPVTALVNGAGVWEIPATQVPGGLNGFTGSVQVTDAAGNVAETPVAAIDGATAAPGVTMANGSGLSGTGEVGATVALLDAAGEPVLNADGEPITAQVNGAGVWTIPATQVSGGLNGFTGSVQVTDAAGNVAETPVAAIDGATAAPGVTVANGTGLSGTGEVGATVALLDAAGEPVLNADGQPITALVNGAGVWTIPATQVPGGLNGFTGSVQVTDAAGNVAETPVAAIDGATAAPGVTVANGTGLSGTGEVGATVALLDAAGEPVLDAGGQPVTALVNGAGVWTIPATQVPGGLNGFTGSVQVTDAAGNVAETPVVSVDGSAPEAVVDAANGSGLSGTGEPGSSVSLTDPNGNPVLGVDGQPIVVTPGADGQWTIPAEVVPGGLDGFVGNVSVEDAAGNVTTAPVGPIDASVTLSLVVDPITGDDVINSLEAGLVFVSVQGRAFGRFTEGDEVRVELSSGVFEVATLDADGRWSVTFTGSQMAASTQVSVSATVSDGAGGSVTISTLRPYDLDLLTPAPSLILANGTGLSGTGEVGATVALLDAEDEPVLDADDQPITALIDGAGVWEILATQVPGGLNGFVGSVQVTDAAGNQAQIPVAAVDGTTPAPGMTVINGSGLSGTGEVGATVALLDAAGEPVLDADGQPVTALVNGVGVWEIPATQVPGGLNGFTGSVQVTDAAGNVAETPVAAIDGTTAAPGVTVANGLGLSGTGEVGATVALLDAAGEPVLNADGEPITAQVNGAGAWTIAATQVPGGLNGFTGSVQVTDAAGNVAETPVAAIDGATAAPGVTVANGTGLSGTGEVGATVALLDAAGEPVLNADGEPITAQVNGAGVWTIAATQVPGGLNGFTGSVQVTDAAGNVAETPVAAIDGATAAPGVTVANGTGLSGTGEVGATVALLDAAGEPVLDVNGQPVTALVNGAGVWTIPATQVPGGLNGFTGSVQVTDAAGNVAGAPVGPIDGAVVMQSIANPVTDDNLISLAEQALATVPVSGQVTGEFEAGDAVVVTLSNGATQTASLEASGAWSVQFSGADLAASSGYQLAVTTTDEAGNQAEVEFNQSFATDLTAPAAPVLAGAGVVGLNGTAERLAYVHLEDSAGQPILGADGQAIIVQANGEGLWSIPAILFVGGQVPAGFRGQVKAVDAAGNRSDATAIPALDVTAPDETTSTLSINALDGDDRINLAGSQAPVEVSGQVTGEFQEGDPVVVTVGSETHTASLSAAGLWQVLIPGSAFVGGTVAVTVQVSDASGNVGAITASRPYSLDVVSPGGADGTEAPVLVVAAADGLIDETELAAGVTANVTLTSGTQEGDTVSVTLTAGAGVRTFDVRVSASDMVAGQVSVDLGSDLGDAVYQATSIIVDAAGNRSASSPPISFEVDAVPLQSAPLSASVSEQALAAVAEGVVATTGATGPVSIQLVEPTLSLTSRGEAVVWTLDALGNLVGATTDGEVVRVTLDSATGAYEVRLLDGIDHQGGAAITLPISLVITDDKGPVSGRIDVTIADGAPVVATPVVLTPQTPRVINGTLVEDFGADGGLLSSVQVGTASFAYDVATDTVIQSGDQGSILAYNLTDGLLSVHTVKGEVVTIDFATGAYSATVTGVGASPMAAAAPTVALGGGSGLLGLLDADVLGLIKLEEQQFFSASDVNNDLKQVVVEYEALVSVGTKRFSYIQALADELGLTVAAEHFNLLYTSTQLTITDKNGGAVDNLKLNEFLGSLSFTSGLGSLLSLNVGQSIRIEATDMAGQVTTEVEGTLADLGLLANLLTADPLEQLLQGTVDGDTINAPDTGAGAALNHRLYGYAGDDLLYGNLGNDLLRGGQGNDELFGGEGNDILIGGHGNDEMTGGNGQDVFRWEKGDAEGGVATDIVHDFNLASLALGGDVLDLASLLQGEGRLGRTAGNLTDFLHFEKTADGTVLHISTTGGFKGGFDSTAASAADQIIVFKGVDFTAGHTSDTAIITDLLGRGKLVVDTLQADGSNPVLGSQLVIGAQGADGDGDQISTRVTVDTSQLQAQGPNPDNAAPVVEAAAANALLDLGLVGFDLNRQDLLVADPNNNLTKVEVEFAPLLAVNLSPLTFGYSEAMALAYGYEVVVTNSMGLLGIVAPSARISITAKDGGTLDNAMINDFLASVHVADPVSGLLNSSLLSVQVLDFLSITAEDSEGLSASAVLGEVLDVNLLNSLDGPDDAGRSRQSAVSDDEPLMLAFDAGQAADQDSDLVDLEAFVATLDQGLGNAPVPVEVLMDDLVEDSEDLIIPEAEADALSAAGTAFAATSVVEAMPVVTSPVPWLEDDYVPVV